MSQPNLDSARLPTFVVSLARAKERRDAICRHLERIGVAYELIDAVDGRALDPSYVRSIVAEGMDIHPGAVGCYLSHLRIYERMKRDSIQVALILEDDARLHPRAKQLIDNGRISTDFDYCFLDSDDHNDSGPIFYDLDSAIDLGMGFRAFTLSAGPQTTHAYLITHKAALKRLQHAYPLQRPIDRYDHLRYAIHFRTIISPKLAWVGEHSLDSFTSPKRGRRQELSWAILRRTPLFYTLRDLLRLKDYRRNRIVPKLIAQGTLPAGRRWRALPSGREVLLVE